MSPDAAVETLADRWIKQALTQPGADADLIYRISSSRDGAGINESALLISILTYADELAKSGLAIGDLP